MRSPGAAAALIGLAAVAAALTVASARGAGPMTGTMGLGLPAFAGTWALMMTAMMLPSATPVALRYTRMIRRRRALRLATFVVGYLGVWSASAIPAYGLMLVVDRAALAGPPAATVTASAILAACGAYQLTGLKDRCLRVCRAPLGQVLRYASWQGPLRDLRVSVHHGGFCLACCWALMALMAVFGAMSLMAMVALMGVVAVEKLAPGGHQFARGVGVVALLLAAAVWWVPGLAPGMQHLHTTM
jgi:predicted metal-binding membrane protein